MSTGIAEHFIFTLHPVIDYSDAIGYNNLMNMMKPNECDINANKCNRNLILKIIRIILSLAVIGMGIYYKNWVGALGLLTLFTAFTGKCGSSIRIGRKKNNMDDPE
jgi:hypothetical protein